jgi:hypothetical protein
MRKARNLRRQRLRNGRQALDQPPAALTLAHEAKSAQPARRGSGISPSYASGAAVHMRPVGSREVASAGESERAQELPSVTLRSTQATRHEVAVSGVGRTIRLEGETTAQFDGGTSQIRNEHVERATDCTGCDDSRCLRVTGVLVLNYRVTTQVSLPSVNDYPDLTPCQRRRVQDAIDNVLAPHEQEHVRAFETYNGTVEHPFDLEVCSTADANAQLQAIHDTDAAQREADAQQESDALDPFHFDVDLDCEDDAGPGDGSGSDSGAAAPEGAAGPVVSEPEPDAEAIAGSAEPGLGVAGDEPTRVEDAR